LLKQLAAIGLSALVLVASSASAKENTAIAGSLAGAAALGLVCTAVALYANDEEVDPEAYDRPGWLLGAGANYAIETFSDDAKSDLQNLVGRTASFSADDNLGINGRFGYRCHSRFSIEAEVEWTKGFEADLNYTLPSGYVDTIDIELERIDVMTNVKGYLLTGRIQPFLLAGLGAMGMKYKLINPDDDEKITIRETQFAMKFGGGVDYYITKNLVVGVDVDWVVAPRTDVGYVLVGGGVQYRF
jgi:opacity protein-like surface antigen